MTFEGENRRWELTPTEARWFLDLRMKLKFKNTEFCKSAGVNASSFSQFTKGKRPLQADVREKLEGFIRKRLEKASFSDPAEKKDLEKLVDQLFLAREMSELGFGYQAPGPFLPVGSPSYVERAADHLTARAMGGGVRSVYVVGGPKTGKSSLVYRIPDLARASGRQVIISKVRETFKDFKWPDEPLSREDLYRSVGVALSDGSADFKELKDDPVWFDDQFFDLLHKHLTKRASVVRVLEDFNELAIRVRRREDLAQLMYWLFSPSRRTDNNLIVITDDGLIGAMEGVSDLVTRAMVAECASVDQVVVQEFAERVFDAEIVKNLFGSGGQASDRLIRAFGNCLFLHHVAFDNMRNYLDSNDGINDDLPLDEAIEDVLTKLQDESRKQETISDPVDRALERFALQCMDRLRLIAKSAPSVAQSDDAADLFSDLSEGRIDAAASAHYVTRRMLEWSGFMSRGGVVPDYVKRICKRGAPK